MRTNRHAAALLVGFALLLAACGGGSSDAASSDGGDGGGTSTTAAPSSDSGSKGGDVDCDEITDAAQQLISIQLLAQLDSPETVEQIKSNQIGALNLDSFIAGMETLHQLDGYAGPLGDPQAAIDLYIDAAKQAQTLFDANPPTQAAIDEYQASIGTTGDFLSHQTAIAGGLEEAGC
jgi:hypothetical protein